MGKRHWLSRRSGMAARQAQSLDKGQYLDTNPSTSNDASTEKSPAIAYLTALEHQPATSTTGTLLPLNQLPASNAYGASVLVNYPLGEALGYVVEPAFPQASWQGPFSDFSGQECPIGSSLVTSTDIIEGMQGGLLPSGLHSTMEGNSASLTSSAPNAMHESHRSSKRPGGSTRATCLQVCAAYVVLMFVGLVVLVLLMATGVWPPRQGITTTTLRIETLRNRYGFFDPSITASPSNDYDSVSSVETGTRTHVRRALVEPMNSTELLYNE